MPSRPPRWPKGIAALAASLVVLFFLVEGALRLRQWARYGTVGSLIVLEPDPASGLSLPVPGDYGPIHINAEGFRGPLVERPKPARRMRLAFLGASTTYCAQSSSERTTWPDLLIQSLGASHPEVEFDYVNAGVPGYTTAESLANLRHRVAPLEPDVVVIYHATNDLVHDARELAFDQGLVESLEPQRRDDTWCLTWNLLVKNLLYPRGTPEALQGRLEFEPQALATTFAEKLRRLIRASQERAPLVAVATFAHRARRDQGTEEQRAACASSLYYMPYMSVPGILAAFEAHNEAIRAEATAAGVLLVQGEQDFDPETCFTDSVHFTDEGCRVMAQRMFDALEASQVFRDLLEAKR